MPRMLFAARSAIVGSVLLCLLQNSGVTQTRSEVIRFENYRSDDIFRSAPAAPKIANPIHRRYRTRIRVGVEKGWGVFRNGIEAKGPNFAGHMIVVRWGCGTGCAAMVFVDARTGDIYNPPLSIGRMGDQRIGLPMFQGGIAEVEYRLTSQVFKIKACPGEPSRLSLDDPCYKYDFLWEDNRWTLLRRQRLSN